MPLAPRPRPIAFGPRPITVKSRLITVDLEPISAVGGPPDAHVLVVVFADGVAVVAASGLREERLSTPKYSLNTSNGNAMNYKRYSSYYYVSVHYVLKKRIFFLRIRINAIHSINDTSCMT